MIDKDFLSGVADLYSRSMGTELMAPLLYALIRSTRPRTVLEIGVGYSTPFILRALADNAADFARERDAVPDDHVLLASYFEREHAPVLHAVDNMAHADSTAPRVVETVARLELSSFLRLHQRDFRGFSEVMDPEALPFDLIWFDCGALNEYSDFLAEYWDLVNPSGGMILLHSTLTNATIHGVILRLKLRQATQSFNDFELLSLLEPHKRVQNSVTLIRMTSDDAAPFYTIHP
jgi:predicted O-methyltransferase YrrM